MMPLRSDGPPALVADASAGVADEVSGAVPGPRLQQTRGWRESLGWSATSAPVALLLLVGMGLGRDGVNLLTPAQLSLLDPVVPVALAALGALVGLGTGGRRADDRRLFVAAALAAAVPMVVVAVGIAAIVLAATSIVVQPFWTLVGTCGICAATSLTLPTGNPLHPRSLVTRIAELGVLLPIVAGGLLLATLGEGSPRGAVLLLVQASGVTLALSAASWLLLARTTSATEERVFVVAALLLVGGVADALSLSALFGGLVAGTFWRAAGRRPREAISRDVLFVQHPLLVLVLLAAGARTELSAVSLGLGAGYLLLRVAGTFAGGALARRTIGVRAPRDLSRHLLPPGAFGVAFTVNAVAIAGAEGSVVLSAIVLGTIGSDVAAFLLSPRSTSA